MSLNKFTIQKSFAISAGAGSGKTYTLSRRYINALLGFDYFRECYKLDDDKPKEERKCFEIHQPFFKKKRAAKVNEIVTITYTEAAALEMKGRIFELVSKIINPPSNKEDGDYKSIVEANTGIENIPGALNYVQDTLTQAFRDSSNAKISTIHAYCLDIIKANADIAQIDTQLDIVKDDEKEKMLSQIIFEVLDDKANREMVLDISKSISTYFLKGLIEKYVSSAKFREDYNKFDEAMISREEYKALIGELYPLLVITDEIIDEVESAKDAQMRKPWFEEYVENFRHFDAKPWKSFTYEKVYKSGQKKGEHYAAALSLGAKTYPALNAFVEEMESLLEFYAPIDEEKEAHFFEKIAMIKEILSQIKQRYDDWMAKEGKIDFDTIITKTAKLLKSVKPEFKYIMVDEFQDTNQTQYEIVTKSMREDTNLFVVGDSKQSIYSFQGAEIEVFNNAVEDRKMFVSKENMDKNHRSDGVVLDRVNKIFEKLLKKESRFKIIAQDFEAQYQGLKVFDKSKEGKGSFNYLITSQPYLSKDDESEREDEMETIARFIEELCNKRRDEYKHISELIENKQQAIAVLFDGGDKMLQLKAKLRERGIAAKISKSENFYHTKEVNDIFNVLKAIDILSKNPEELTAAQKYYVAGAMRSNILRVDDNHIKQHIEANTVDERLNRYVEIFRTLPLAQAVKYIYDDSNVMGVYAHLDDVEQRSANLYKFLTLCREYEQSSESSLYSFLSLIENAIYFSEAKEDEAFFQSDNTKSIELCTIHATKGLAYPMVILANADKGLYSQISSDALKHNNFTMNGERKEIVGFKIDNYVPLSHRVLKQIDKMKHLAEKKRLLYVALTRAKHDVVVSAYLKEKKEGGITLSEDSYLHMIIDSLGIEVKSLFWQEEKACIVLNEEEQSAAPVQSVSYVAQKFVPIAFTKQKTLSATSPSEETSSVDETAARRGTIVHKIIEIHWENFNENQEAILDKMEVYEQAEREAVKESMQRFYESDLYAKLKEGADHHFELEFNTQGKRGFIDCIYYDEVKAGWVIVDFKTGNETAQKTEQYQQQLDFYRGVLEEEGKRVAFTQLLWL